MTDSGTETHPDPGSDSSQPPLGDHTTDAVAKGWVLWTTAFCLFFGLAGHAALWWGYYRGASQGPIAGWTWQPIIGLSLTGVALGSFGGYFVASRRARTAIAASFLLTFLLSFTYALTISGFADLKTDGAEALFNDFRTICLAIIGAYFGTEAVITTTKIIQVGHTEGATVNDLKTADRDLAPPPSKGRDAPSETRR
jgi:apolipoprotein N-acyltransferase